METTGNTSTSQKTIRRVYSIEDHRAELREVFQAARERVLIVSPTVSISAIREDNIDDLVRAAVNRGVKVVVCTDDKLNRIDGELKYVAKTGMEELIRAGATVTIRDGIHNKTLIRDNDLIAQGNFLWLSAPREGEKVKKACTVVTEGESARVMIANEMKRLSQRPANSVNFKRQAQPEGAKGPKTDPVQPVKVVAQERGNGRAAADLNVKSWDPSSASPKKAIRVLGWIALGAALAWPARICAAVAGWKLHMDPPEFFMTSVFFIIFVGFVSWKLSGGTKIFEPCGDDYLSHPGRSFSDGPSVNVDGSPMFGGVDIHGNAYGIVNPPVHNNPFDMGSGR